MGESLGKGYRFYVRKKTESFRPLIAAYDGLTSLLISEKRALGLHLTLLMTGESVLLYTSLLNLKKQ